MRTVPCTPMGATTDPRWEYVRKRFKAQPEGNVHDYTKMPNGWWIYDGPRLVTVNTWRGSQEEATGVEKVDHATLLGMLWNAMQRRVTDLQKHEPHTTLAYNAGMQWTILSAAFDLVQSDAETGSSLAVWRGPRELVDMALTLVHSDTVDGVYLTTEWEEF